jgi:hypothetical protein
VYWASWRWGSRDGEDTVGRCDVIRKGGGDMSLKSGLRICETTPCQDTDMHKPATLLGSSRYRMRIISYIKRQRNVARTHFLRLLQSGTQ